LYEGARDIVGEVDISGSVERMGDDAVALLSAM
jgi:hypothetical protein